MSRKKLSRNAPCPCGSGKKYKHCCWGKDSDWQEDAEGRLYQSIPMFPEIADILQEQRRRFIEKYGREPGPGDPVFFDMPPLEHLEAKMAETMKEAGIDPALIYAFEKTGRLVTEQNQHSLPQTALDEWQAAVEEFRTKDRKSENPPQFPIGTVALYGPNDKTTTKIAAGVFLREGGEAIIQRWVATDVTTNPKVQQEMKDFFLHHGVKSVAMSEGNMGCPHEEGPDFPQGEDCPFCPFWKGKQGSNQRE